MKLFELVLSLDEAILLLDFVHRGTYDFGKGGKSEDVAWDDVPKPLQDLLMDAGQADVDEHSGAISGLMDTLDTLSDELKDAGAYNA